MTTRRQKYCVSCVAHLKSAYVFVPGHGRIELQELVSTHLHITFTNTDALWEIWEYQLEGSATGSQGNNTAFSATVLLLSTQVARDRVSPDREPFSQDTKQKVWARTREDGGFSHLILPSVVMITDNRPRLIDSTGASSNGCVNVSFRCSQTTTSPLRRDFYLWIDTCALFRNLLLKSN